METQSTQNNILDKYKGYTLVQKNYKDFLLEQLLNIGTKIWDISTIETKKEFAHIIAIAILKTVNFDNIEKKDIKQKKKYILKKGITSFTSLFSNENEELNTLVQNEIENIKKTEYEVNYINKIEKILNFKFFNNYSYEISNKFIKDKSDYVNLLNFITNILHIFYLALNKEKYIN